MKFKEYLKEEISGAKLAAADKKLDAKKQSVIKKAKAWMKKLNKSAEQAAEEFDLNVQDLNESEEINEAAPMRIFSTQESRNDLADWGYQAVIGGTENGVFMNDKDQVVIVINGQKAEFDNRNLRNVLAKGI